MKYQITSERQYHDTMILIYHLMDKGESNINDTLESVNLDDGEGSD
jgi:hypothetical protein